MNKNHGREPLIAFVTGPRAADFIAVRQQLKIGESKFAPDAALNNRAKELARQKEPRHYYNHK